MTKLVLHLSSALFCACAFANPLKFTAEATQLSEWTLEVSSRLSPQGASTYGPEHLLNGPDTAWVEGAAGDGVGEWIKITEAGGRRNMKFQSVTIWNGYQKSKKSFAENGRVKALVVSWKGGSESVALEDRMGEQTIRLRQPVSSPWVKFEIASAFPGTRFSDTAISGISVDLEEFNYGEKPVVPADLASLVAGRWEGARHTTEYRADGTFMLDPEPGEWVPLGHWKIEGDVLVAKWKDSGETSSSAIVSINDKEMVIRAANGKEYTLRKLRY